MKLTRPFLSLLSILGLTIAFAQNATTTPDLTTVKKELVQYVHSGQYNQELMKVTESAQTYLKARLDENAKANPAKKLAVVFDIDETTLSNYPTMEHFGFGGTEAELDDQINLGNDPAIAPSLSLYQFAEKNHVAVFFITGRRDWQRQATIRNLKQEGYTTWNELYMKPNHYYNISVIPYKSSVRKKIADEGYDIVFSMGDQLSDLEGGFADQTFKLPNPFYFIP